MTGDRDRNVLLLLTGLFAMWLALSGTVLDYVRPSMRPYVLVAGVVALLLSLLPPGGLLGHRATVDDHAHGGTGVAWLLVAPLLVVLVVPPSPLGANAVGSRRLSVRDAGSLPPLRPSVQGAVPMSMAEFATRALRDPSRSLDGIRVRLRGFVSSVDGGEYTLARFVIFCCAADGEAVEVRVVGDPDGHAVDAWLTVEGVWQQSADDEVPVLRATKARATRAPRPPYEYTTVWTG